MSILHVVAPGFLTTIQDPRGRPGYGRYGVPAGGAMDPFAAEAANRLVGNPPHAALLELTLMGPTLRVEGAGVAIALAGADLGATIDGQPIAPGWSWLARIGSVLEFSAAPPHNGVRAYLAVAGGIELPPVLGSASTDLRSELGGLDGRALRAGDLVRIAQCGEVLSRCGRYLAAACLLNDPDERVRVLPGPHVARFTPGALEQLVETEWRIADGADRMGYRLLGPPLRHVADADVASLGLPVGAIQVPGSGEPIVLLADHQPTGGYTVLACVIRADLGSIAQRRPGDALRFALTSEAEARAALAARRQAVTQAPIDSDNLDAARWT